MTRAPRAAVMARPPACVAFVARTHAVVGAVVAVSTLAMSLLARRIPQIEWSAPTYFATGGLATYYLLTSLLVWRGAPLGPLCSRVCTLLYLARPNFGSLLWETMNTPEFKAHFKRRSA